MFGKGFRRCGNSVDSVFAHPAAAHDHQIPGGGVDLPGARRPGRQNAVEEVDAAADRVQQRRPEAVRPRQPLCVVPVERPSAGEHQHRRLCIARRTGGLRIRYPGII